MTLAAEAWLGGVVCLVLCLVLLAALAIISQVSDNEPPEFVYLVGVALAVAAWVMLSKAGF